MNVFGGLRVFHAKKNIGDSRNFNYNKLIKNSLAQNLARDFNSKIITNQKLFNHAKTITLLQRFATADRKKRKRRAQAHYENQCPFQPPSRKPFNDLRLLRVLYDATRSGY
jgi:hypothetical protein